ncbi:MAG: mechanosensitive ion channel [Clostridiaceae bacterium]|nr:mechanosensitive ion channel [Clostridiaceae bacterium]
MNDTLQKLWDILIELSASIGLKILLAIAVLVIGLLLIKYLVKFIVKSKGFNKIDKTVQTFIKSALSITLKILLIISVIGILGVPLTSIIAVLASAGLAIGLALQGALSNFAGGIMILVFRPFKVGDFVDNGTHMGTVDSITIFYTRLLTIDNKLITIPNSTMTTASITNFSAKELRRVDFKFTASYKNDVEKVKRVLTEIAESHPLVLKDQPIMSRLFTHGANSLEYILRVWCQAPDYWTIYFDINETVKKEFDAQGIEIPYTQMDVHIKGNNIAE